MAGLIEPDFARGRYKLAALTESWKHLMAVLIPYHMGSGTAELLVEAEQFWYMLGSAKAHYCCSVYWTWKRPSKELTCFHYAQSIWMEQLLFSSLQEAGSCSCFPFSVTRTINNKFTKNKRDPEEFSFFQIREDFFLV